MSDSDQPDCEADVPGSRLGHVDPVYYDEDGRLRLRQGQEHRVSLFIRWGIGYDSLVSVVIFYGFIGWQWPIYLLAGYEIQLTTVMVTLLLVVIISLATVILREFYRDLAALLDVQGAGTGRTRAQIRELFVSDGQYRQFRQTIYDDMFTRNWADLVGVVVATVGLSLLIGADMVYYQQTVGDWRAVLVYVFRNKPPAPPLAAAIRWTQPFAVFLLYVFVISFCLRLTLMTWHFLRLRTVADKVSISIPMPCVDSHMRDCATLGYMRFLRTGRAVFRVFLRVATLMFLCVFVVAFWEFFVMTFMNPKDIVIEVDLTLIVLAAIVCVVACTLIVAPLLGFKAILSDAKCRLVNRIRDLFEKTQAIYLLYDLPLSQTRDLLDETQVYRAVLLYSEGLPVWPVEIPDLARFVLIGVGTALLSIFGHLFRFVQ